MPNAHTALTARVGPTLTAALTGGEGGSGDPRRAVALRIFQMIEAQEGANLAGAWMVGGNPALGDDTPVMAIRERRFEQLEAAANHLAG